FTSTQLTQSTKSTLNLSKQAQGVYYLQISTSEQTITKKIVIE
ncbi:MAG: T9SS type A sorting domain-containing protein, partial [Bacteroidetes bacterium]|nr:T9SS type A sorting domain-containing protein [Bacteroidota bacterium]